MLSTDHDQGPTPLVKDNAECTPDTPNDAALKKKSQSSPGLPRGETDEPQRNSDSADELSNDISKALLKSSVYSVDSNVELYNTKSMPSLMSDRSNSTMNTLTSTLSSEIARRSSLRAVAEEFCPNANTSKTQTRPSVRAARGGRTKNDKGLTKRQMRCKTWELDQLEQRKSSLIGTTVVGRLSPLKGKRYYIKWHKNQANTVTMSQTKVEQGLGKENVKPGMWVAVKIAGLGPAYARWDRQHPYAQEIEAASGDRDSPRMQATLAFGQRLPPRCKSMSRRSSVRSSRLSGVQRPPSKIFSSRSFGVPDRGDTMRGKNIRQTV